MSQSELNFGRLYRLDEEYKAAFRATEDTVDQVGLIVAAGASGMESPDLNKTFAPNSGRHLRLRTTMAIGAVAGFDARRAIITPIARLFGFDVQPQKPRMTPEQRIARMEARVMERFGQAGVELLAELQDR
jgi:hypothetical protein